ncbi:saccharopine dehydrogenase-like oxidoreductase [Parasteatoda tepidariorum]|uniref:saccharopine dehydrogenase-like oxidoreductase n=1 Tax=Parasteatoda tepidariorum TaxID=114398 RepID=UPI0039BC6BED
MGGRFSVMIKAEEWREKLTDKHTSPPNKTVTAVFSGPDPGYLTTAILVVNPALVVLQEKDKLPPNGGVLTPGAAFSDTSLLKRIEKRGITIIGV